MKSEGKQMSDQPPTFDEDERKFQEFCARHPGATYAQYSVADQAEKIKNGYVHASLGPSVQGRDDWWKAGIWAFRTFSGMAKISEYSKVVEYGCGSLRVGAHFIKLLAPGNYAGLDVTTDFIEYGKEKIAGLLDEKQPYLAAISEESLSFAERLQPDLVYSPAVAFHVHPSDEPEYIDNLKRMASKTGARVVFDCKLSNKEWRYHETGWVHKASFYIQKFAPLTLIDFYNVKDNEEKGGKVSTTILMFQRD
jgi:SAM-dependent methyltransferase